MLFPIIKNIFISDFVLSFCSHYSLISVSFQLSLSLFIILQYYHLPKLSFFSFFFFFLGPHPWYIEVPRLGVILELHMPADATAIATQDLSCVCNLYHSSWQCWTLNPLSKTRDWTCNLMVPSLIGFHCTTIGTPLFTIFKFYP